MLHVLLCLVYETMHAAWDEKFKQYTSGIRAYVEPYLNIMQKCKLIVVITDMNIKYQIINLTPWSITKKQHHYHPNEHPPSFQTTSLSSTPLLAAVAVRALKEGWYLSIAAIAASPKTGDIPFKLYKHIWNLIIIPPPQDAIMANKCISCLGLRKGPPQKISMNFHHHW